MGTTSCGPACRASSAAHVAGVGLVGGHVRDRAGVGGVPLVHLGLDAVALGQQGGVLGGQLVDDGVKASPELGAVDAGAGQDLVFDEAEELGGHLQAVNLGACGHGEPLEKGQGNLVEA